MGGHLSRRGKVGSTEATHSIYRPKQSAGGRVPSGPPLQVPCPAPSGSDLGQLITALALGLCLDTPKINTFSGDVTPGKTEVSFEQLNHKVQCIKDHYPESVVQESIMRSLKGGSSRYGSVYGPYCQYF